MAAPAASLRKELLSWEPHVRMVSPCNVLSGDGRFRVATLELSNLDLLHDYYNSVLLVYDVQGGATHVPPSQDEPVRRLLRALEKLLVCCPSAAGVLVNNESDGRLEVRYPVPLTATSLSATGIPNHQYPAAPYGVQFHVAHANATLSDLGDVSDPRPCFDLLYPPMQHPVDTDDFPLGARSIMAFQLTTFECGGFTLAHTCSHVYADGYSAAMFLQSLCSIARSGEALANPPNFQQSRRAALRPREPPSPTMNYIYPFLEMRRGWRTISRDQQVQAAAPTNHHQLQYGTATRFAFSMDALEALRSRGSYPDDAKPCTRSQALFALILSAYARMELRVRGLPRSEEMTVRFPMNARTRGVLTTRYMGDAVYFCPVSATLGELSEKPLAYVVHRIKSTMEGLDMPEAVQSVIDDIEVKLRDGLMPFLGTAGKSLVSLVGLPFYDTDCGWGRPMYVGRPSRQLCNRCIVLEHPAARAWNVLLVFASAQERACFQEVIADYIN